MRARTVSTISILSERRMPYPRTIPRHPLLRPSSITLTCMTDTISRAIPKVSENGVLELPRSAWAEIEQVADEEFGLAVSVHDHKTPGAFHGRPFVPFAHYLFEVTLEEEVIESFIERIDPLIEALIESHTQQPAVPAGK